MTKSILIFSIVYYPRCVGGAEVAVKEITDRISREKIHFHMVTLATDASIPTREEVGNVTVHRVGRWMMFGGASINSPRFRVLKYLFPIIASVKASQLHCEYNFTAIWSIMANYAGFAALFFKLFHINVRFILTLQEGDPIDSIKKAVRFVSPLFRMIFTHADTIQAISHYLAHFAIEMGARTTPIVIPNGVDIDLFTRETDDGTKSKILSSIGIGANDRIVITTSRLVEKNAVDDIIHALAYLPDEVKLLIVGEGEDENVLRGEATILGLSHRVFFLGYKPHSDIADYLKISDVFVRPSRSEGLGNSFLEAMASGVPVIATRVGGIPDFLTDKVTGLFCDIGSPKDIARKIDIYLKDGILRREIIDSAREMVRNKYDWRAISNDMEEKVFDSQ